MELGSFLLQFKVSSSRFAFPPPPPLTSSTGRESRSSTEPGVVWWPLTSCGMARIAGIAGLDQHSHPFPLFLPLISLIPLIPPSASTRTCAHAGALQDPADGSLVSVVNTAALEQFVDLADPTVIVRRAAGRRSRQTTPDRPSWTDPGQSMQATPDLANWTQPHITPTPTPAARRPRPQHQLSRQRPLPVPLSSPASFAVNGVPAPTDQATAPPALHLGSWALPTEPTPARSVRHSASPPSEAARRSLPQTPLLQSIAELQADLQLAVSETRETNSLVSGPGTDKPAHKRHPPITAGTRAFFKKKVFRNWISSLVPNQARGDACPCVG